MIILAKKLGQNLPKDGNRSRKVITRWV